MAKEPEVSNHEHPDVEAAVRERYSTASHTREAELCCPTSYDPNLLAVIPTEVIERDYGCGDPSRHLRAGETVLDLGSGTGKICFIAAQVVGATGRVIGVDMNDDMLAIARAAAPTVAERVGYSNVEFRKGKIQELGPIVPDGSVDVVVSNCVLNLVQPQDKQALFGELFRVLRRGGRVVISDIVSDEDVPEHLQRDPELWSGCISGAFREDRFLEAFESAGFHGLSVLERGAEPWRVVEGIEFRSVTVAAWRGKQGPCLDQKHAVIYRGPFKQIEDDDGHVFRRGVRTAVCEKTFRLFSQPPYRDHVDLVEPRELVPLEQAPPFACDRPRVRDPRESKGLDYHETTEAGPVCEPGKGCC